LLAAYCGSRKQRDKQAPTTAGWTAPRVCQFYLRSLGAKDPPSNAVLIFHPEFRYALKKRSVPVRNGSQTRSNGRFAKGASRVMAEGVSDGGSGTVSCRSPATL
jgi:hypothetical protein